MKSLGASLVALTPEKPDNSLTTAQKNALGYEILSDPGNAVAREYGLVFSLADELKPLLKANGAELPVWNGDGAWELPIPATYVIDSTARIRLAFVDADYTKRLEPAAILACLRRLVGRA